ncbi:helix-turn-helix domain-containing protein [Neobacillus niacini]|uniref:helix-turn-helix domain-containing protein n=1 Tax=Neobacillus niacini TaxID=86668 RepID=UPI001C8D2B75|nr:helix-turn-helix transcriptional regulator [Neobacillus niacini]MBY0144314.1 helix-turn-helix transcriptional regulator [Neobacillus niacini]
MKNPLVAIREEKGLTVSEFGILAGVSTMTIQRIEQGNVQNISSDVLDILEGWGYSRGQFTEDYVRWKMFKIKQLQEKIR